MGTVNALKVMRILYYYCDFTFCTIVNSIPHCVTLQDTSLQCAAVVRILEYGSMHSVAVYYLLNIVRVTARILFIHCTRDCITTIYLSPHQDFQ